jgi:hypothetical protein
LTPPKVTGTSDVLSALKMSGIDKLHALGIKGKGMKIGIIDTGVDYRHPSLGGGFGPGFKIAGGHAYRNDAGKAVCSADPLTTCVAGGHGTHVAGSFIPPVWFARHLIEPLWLEHLVQRTFLVYINCASSKSWLSEY